jgi:hypothetical protein
MTNETEEGLFWKDFGEKFHDIPIFESASGNLSKEDPDYRPNFMTPFEFITLSPIDVSKLINTY